MSFYLLGVAKGIAGEMLVLVVVSLVVFLVKGGPSESEVATNQIGVLFWIITVGMTLGWCLSTDWVTTGCCLAC